MITDMQWNGSDCPLGAMTDEALLVMQQECWHRQQEVMDELFRRYRARVAQWCYRFTRDRQTALDLVQDIFIRAFRSLRSYRGDSRFSTWLYVITRNVCMSALERVASEPKFLETSEALHLVDTSFTDALSRLAAEQESRHRVQEVLTALTALEANVLMLHYGQEMPLRDVTAMLDLRNKSGAKAYIVSARRKLAGLGIQRMKAA